MGKGNDKSKLTEECRFVIWDNMMESEVKIGRTLFEISSRFKDNSTKLKDVIEKVTEHTINRLNIQVG